MHIALLLLRGDQVVQFLGIPGGAEGSQGEDLRLTACEQA